MVAGSIVGDQSPIFARKGVKMANAAGKVVVNLATGHEDADRVTVAFLVPTAALERGRPVAMFTTKEAVRLGLPGYAQAIESAGAPPVSRLFQQFVDRGGELMLCPICFKARGLDEQTIVDGARLAGATRWGEGMGNAPAPVFTYGAPAPGSTSSRHDVHPHHRRTRRHRRDSRALRR